MKKSIFTIATIATILFATTATATTIDPNNANKEWNNKGKELTFKKGDTVKIKVGSFGSQFLTVGIVDYVCNSKYLKVNGFFILISDIEVITLYAKPQQK